MIAVLAWFEFGQSAEDQVVDVAGDLTTMVAIVLVPVLLVGLITVPFYRWIARKLVGFIAVSYTHLTLPTTERV